MKKIILEHLRDLKSSSEPIACLTAYDATQASFFEKCGVEVLLVGDSLGMNVKGQESTVSTTMRDMLYHTKCVSRAAKKSYVISDMPFLTYSNPEIALKNAGKLIQEGSAKMVKLEGSEPNILEAIKFLTKNHIPVCGHLGLNPQAILETGKYSIAKNSEENYQKLNGQLKDLEKVGVTMVVLECVPHEITKRIIPQTNMIVIGIGSGSSTDGQILVHYDLMGMGKKKMKFTRDFISNLSSMGSAVDPDKSALELGLKSYVEAVKNRTFPSLEESF